MLEATILARLKNRPVKQWVINMKIIAEVLACSGVVYYYITKSPKHLDGGLN
jgi:hypothetical protein